MQRPHQAAKSGITRYLELYTCIAQELADGRFGPGKALPSEPELVRTHGVSRTTVRRALDRLEREGRVIRRRGSGTYACERKEFAPMSLDLSRFGELLPAQAGAKKIHSGSVVVPLGLRSRYALGERAKTIRRLRSEDGAPYQLETIYLNTPNRNGRRRLDEAEHEVTAVSADAASSRHLRVPVGTPLLRLRSEFRSKDGALVAVVENLIRCDRANVGVSGPTARGRRPKSRKR